jgi:hypothetical protein
MKTKLVNRTPSKILFFERHLKNAKTITDWQKYLHNTKDLYSKYIKNSVIRKNNSIFVFVGRGTGFELRALCSQAGILPVEPHL